MFGLDYAEINWLMFPSLRKIVDQHKDDKLFDDIEDLEFTTLVENYKIEYAYI